VGENGYFQSENISQTVSTTELPVIQQKFESHNIFSCFGTIPEFLRTNAQTDRQNIIVIPLFPSPIGAYNLYCVGGGVKHCSIQSNPCYTIIILCIVLHTDALQI